VLDVSCQLESCKETTFFLENRYYLKVFAEILDVRWRRGW